LEIINESNPQPNVKNPAQTRILGSEMKSLIGEDRMSELETFIGNLVSLNEVEENSTLLIRSEIPINHIEIQNIRRFLPKGVLIWLVPFGKEIEIKSIDEKEMNRHGWYKKPNGIEVV